MLPTKNYIFKTADITKKYEKIKFLYILEVIEKRRGSGGGSGSGAGSGSISQRYGSGDPDPDMDPHQNVTDLNTASYVILFFLLKISVN